MLLKKINYKKLLNKIASIRRIQSFWRIYLKEKLRKFELKRQITEINSKNQQDLVFKSLPIPKTTEKTEKNLKKVVKPDIFNKNPPKTEKFQKQRESIRKLHEPKYIPKTKLTKIQSNRDFLEENNKLLTKKTSYPIIIKESSLNNIKNEDFFTNNWDNTKKINNLIANANALLSSNLKKIYGEKKKENSQKTTKEENTNNELFNFFHKNNSNHFKK